MPAPRTNRVTVSGVGQVVIPVDRFMRTTTIQISVSGTASWALRWSLVNPQSDEEEHWIDLSNGSGSGEAVIKFPVMSLLLAVESGDGDVTALITQSRSSSGGSMVFIAAPSVFSDGVFEAGVFV